MTTVRDVKNDDVMEVVRGIKTSNRVTLSALAAGTLAVALSWLDGAERFALGGEIKLLDQRDRAALSLPGPQPGLIERQAREGTVRYRTTDVSSNGGAASSRTSDRASVLRQILLSS